MYAMSHGDIGMAAEPWAAKDMTPFPPSALPPATENLVPGQALDEEAAFSRPSRVQWGALLEDGDSIADEFMTPAEYARFALTDGVMRDGIAFVTEMPVDRTGNSIDAQDTSSPTLARLAEMVSEESHNFDAADKRKLGEIRHTFYGSLWNVRSLGSSSRNIAYTNLDLGLHMDLCYFQNPPRFQFLHMLRNRVRGGQSIFVDSYAVAEHMWKYHRDAWKWLTEVPVCFQYRNDNRHYRYTHPTFEVAQSSSGHAGQARDSGMPRLTAVNYSPPFQGPLPLHFTQPHNTITSLSVSQRHEFYKALETFAYLTLEPTFRYERMLQEGECVLFDNRRVLHSRRGFEWDPALESETSDEDVKRWLKGMCTR